MFSKSFNIMLYVADVAAEKHFWSAIGFEIFNETTIMGFDSFDMKPSQDSTVSFTVYAADFIKQVSPEVLDCKPSILFETQDIEALHARLVKETKTTSDIRLEPFPNFNFANPSGHYFAVKGID